MQRQTKCGGRRKGVVSGGVLATLVLATTCAAMAQGRPAGGTSESAHGPLLAQAGPTVSFEIAPQPLATAITAFARQSGYQVSVDHGALAGLASPGISGSMTPEAALPRLLAGTGVTWRFADDRSVVLTRTPAGGPGAMNLGPITVQGATETAWGPVEGYRASRSATGSKTDTPILELPASVQVVPRQVIEDQGALNLKDVYENVSSVQQAGNTLNAQAEVLPIIRGFESPTLLRNGLRATTAGTVDLASVERVEVLKGPASILYGALEPGGIVNYVTKRPQAETRHVLEQQAGSYDFFRTSADSTGALSEDKSLMYRANFAYTNSGSFRDHIELERIAAAPSLLWQPTTATELLIDASYVHEEQPYDTGIPLDANGEPLVPRETFFGDPDLAGRSIDDYAIGYQLSHDFNTTWNLRHQLQFHRAEAKNEALRPRSVTGDSGSEELRLRYQNEDRRTDEIQAVLDATAKFSTGTLGHTLLLGGEAIFQDLDFRRYRENVPSVAITANPVVNFDPPSDQPQQAIIGETQWGAVYLQDQVSMLEGGRLKLLFGGRYDIVHQEQVSDGTVLPDMNDQAFTGRVGALYELTDQFSPYVSVSQSFQPQSPDVIDVDGQALDPEEGLQYEAGIKGSFLDDRLLVTASVYQIEKKNVAVFDDALFDETGQDAYFPGVRERSRGFELDASGQLSDAISIIANYSYTDTEVLENQGDPSMVGEPLGGVPAHKARVWLTYSFGEDSNLDGLGVGAGARYVGESTTQFDTSVKLDPYVVFDAGVWYAWNSVKVGLNLHNLLDEDYIVRASDDAIAHPGQPRTAMGYVSVRF